MNTLKHGRIAFAVSEKPSLSHATKTDLAFETVEVNERYYCTTAVLALRPHQVQMYKHRMIAYRDGIDTNAVKLIKAVLSLN